MNSSRDSFLKIGIILLCLQVCLAGCKKEEDKPAPEIPPPSTFVMDFSDFSNPDDTLAPREWATHHNWGWAYANVMVWNTLITIELSIPVASFVESLNHEAVYHPDKDNWTWSYNVTIWEEIYEAELTGYLQADSVAWEMRITRSNMYSDFLWYYGKSALDQSSGHWILNDKPSNPAALLRIDWNRYSDNTADIRYMNVLDGGPENGGYIFYGTSIGDLDRNYDIYNKGLDNLTEIEWSSVNHNGHVKDAVHFGDDLWHCWDTDLSDIECP